jgi:hypothetical protein
VIDHGKGVSGLVLDRLGLLPAAVAIAWIVAGLPLLVAGVFRPLPAVLLFLVVVGAMGAWAWRAARPYPVPTWSLLAVGTVALAATVSNVLLRSEHVVLRRDAGSYAQFADWLAGHGRLPIPARLGAFGGPDPALVVDSPAFYGIGDAVQPQFMTGLPLLLAAGDWMAGWTGMLMVSPVLVGCALLAFGALTARLVGPRWAPLAVLALAAAQPVWHVARSTYSESLALLLVLAAFLALTRALEDRGRAAGAAALAGFLLAGSAAVRVDALREIMLAVAVAGALLAARRREAWPFVGGLAAGLTLGVADGLLLSSEYLRDVGASLRPLLALLAATVLVTAIAVPVLRARGPLRLPGWAPTAAGGTVLAGFVLLAARPWLYTDRGQPPRAARAVAGLQARQGLPVDGQRTYAEQTMQWLAWWVGWPLLALAAVAAGLLVAKAVRGEGSPAWPALLVVMLGSTVLSLVRPGITPDHPWAERRFVVVALPALVLLATFAARWLTSKAVRPAARRPVALLAGVAIIAPTVWASAALFPLRTEVGQPGAVEQVCAALPADAAVLLLDPRAKREWPPALRGRCGVPAASVGEAGSEPPSAATVRRLVAATRAAGHTPVLLTAGSPDPLVAVGAEPRKIVTLDTHEDARVLEHRPSHPVPLAIEVWLAVPVP